jgi:hypothetical protein
MTPISNESFHNPQESEHGKKELEVSDISKHNWLQEFNALSAA